MSPAQDASPGVVSTPDPGTSASGTESGSARTASGSQDSGSGDYLERIRTDPEFAAREVVNHQSRADKADAERKALQEWRAALGDGYANDTPDAIRRALDDYVAMREDEKVMAAIERARGSSSTTTSVTDDTDDEYLSDEAREIKQLKATVASLESRLGQTEFSDGQQALNTHMEQIRKDWGLPDEVFQKGSEATAAKIVAWKTRGGEAGRQAIESLKGPNGREVVEGIMIPAIGRKGLLQALDDRDRRSAERLSGLATDVPSGHASSGREPPPKFTGPDAHLKAAAWARANPNAHDAR